MSLRSVLTLALLLSAGCSNAAEQSSKSTVKDTALITAASQGKISEVQSKIKAGSDVNVKNAEGQTALMAAASNGKIEALKALLTAKADLNIKDTEKQTALYYAITNEQSAAALLLIEAGADLKSLNEMDDNAATLASSLNDIKILNAILKKDPSVINKANSNGKTALMEAARHGTKKTISILLTAGADKTLKNKNSQTALDIAKKAQNEDAVQLLSGK